MTHQNGSSSHLPRFDSSSTVPLWLDGKEITASKTFQVSSPANGETLYRGSAASEEDVSKAVESAEKAFRTWSETKPNERRDIILRAAEILQGRKEELFSYSHAETGEPRSFFEFDFGAAINMCKSVAGLIQTIQGSVPTVAENGTSAMVVKEPYGVVLAIAPWNAPHVLGFRACVGPLAAGNTVVLKGPEKNPATTWAIASVLYEAGLPPGCLNTIYNDPSDAPKITSALISSPVVKKVNFTGSTHVGSIIASLAGKHLKPVLMELGGKAPSIVCEDANVNEAAQQCALGSFLHGGQICMATERIIVHRNIVSEFRTVLKESVKTIFGSDAMVLVSPLSVDKNAKLIQDAVGKGADILYGDNEGRETNSTHMRPVVIEGVKDNMDIYKTESFGPTVSLLVVDTDEEAISIANDTEYGLSSAVFTQDLRRGLRIARRIESGAVHINGMTVHDEDALPHGGAKKSGFGRFNGQEGLSEWVRLKSIVWKD